MPKTKATTPYTCPACGYKTDRKDNMKTHFYKSKKPCQKIVEDIELTEEIKLYVLTNRVYHAPKPKESERIRTTNNTINATINNINYVNNLVNNMNILDKLNKYLEYNDMMLIDFEDKISDMYLKTTSRLDNDKNGIELTTQHIIKVIDDVSIVNDKQIENFNIIYDKKCNKLKLYIAGEWKYEDVDSGIMKILEITRDNYWTRYEYYLIRRIKNSDYNVYERQKAKELLEEYYKFIACFDIQPGVQEIDDDSEIMDGWSGDSFVMEFRDLYYKIDNMLDKYTIKQIKTKVTDTIKNNTAHNIDELNKCVINLMHNSNSDFKNFLISALATPS
jgi:hypothetical protein